MPETPSSIGAAAGAPVPDWLRTLLSILIVGLVVAAPLFLLRGLVAERIQLSQQVRAGAAAGWGGVQIVAGPALEIPIVSDGMTRGHIVLLPQALDASAELGVEQRSRGLFEALIYGAKVTLAGRFAAPDWTSLGILTSDLDFSRARLVIGIADNGGIRTAEVTLDGKRLELAPIARAGFVADGVDHPALALALDRLERGLGFEARLELAGTGAFSLAPVGDQSTIRIAGNWPHPEFAGAFLPQAREVGKGGFEARWSVSKLARAYPGAWKIGSSSTSVFDSLVSVRIIDPVDLYAQVDRLLKYGLVVIALAFAAIGTGAVLLRAMPHPIEWLMAGAAVALAFLLTLAFAEHIGFGWGYWVAHAVEVTMVTLYLERIRRWLGIGVGAALLTVHGFIYFVLGSERYALLAGSLGLTLALAAAMALTRRVDWDRLAPLRARRNGVPAAEPG
jgi:inner membrane protein